MSDTPRPTAAELGDPAQAARFFGVADAARSEDGYDPFNEQTRLDLASGARTPLLIEAAGDAGGAAAIGAAVIGGGELDLVIAPGSRGRGVASAVLPGLLERAPDTLTARSHGDHPAAHALAARFGFAAVRTLLQLALDPLPDAQPTERFEAFLPGTDDAEWVALNARVFAFHPEQGGVTVDDLRARQHEDWFDAGDFLVARDDDGRMVGYNWLKLEPGAAEGEIYVLGVDSAASGRGLGRRLMAAGLARLRQRGARAATLYVEADNTPAVALYRSMGFVDRTVDVQYRRGDGAAPAEHPANIS
jgi:mycothiol synthase